MFKRETQEVESCMSVESGLGWFQRVVSGVIPNAFLHDPDAS